MKIVVDTNIVFSALLNSNSKIARILLHSKNHFQFFSCNYLRDEITRHHNKLIKFTKHSEADLFELQTLITQHITFIDERLLSPDLLIKTEIILQSIDPNDTPFLALTKHVNGKLWTGDKQLIKGLTTKRFKDFITTQELSNLLNELESGL